MSPKNNAKGRRLTAAEQAKFRRILLEKHEQILRDVEHLENDSLGKARKDAAGDLSAVPFHMADLASDNYEQEFTLGLLQNEDVGLRDVDEALQRLKNGTFGNCVACSKPISKKRLQAIPYARLCIECQREQEAQVPPRRHG